MIRYLLLATIVLTVAAALMPSSGLAASGGTPSAAAAAVEQLQDLPVGPQAAGGARWAASPAVDANDGCCDDGHMWGWDGWWWWLLMPIGMIAFWGGIIALIVWAIRQFSPNRGGADNAIDIARARYARGEISQEEFDRLRRDLG